MKKIFVFIKLKNKIAVRKINMPKIAKGKGIYAVKKIDVLGKKPYFMVSDLKINLKSDRFKNKSLKGDTNGK